MMSRQHFIPASYIGNFSLKTLKNNRRNIIWVKRRDKEDPYITKAEKVGYKKNIYSDIVDKIWKGTEGDLKKSIVNLAKSGKKGLPVNNWITVVKFISQLFVRGYEFDERFEKRIARVFGDSEKLKKYINIDKTRLLESQRLYAPIMYAKWLVLHNKTNLHIVTNDLGFCLMMDYRTKKFGYAFPLSTKEVLVLTISNRSRKRQIPADVYNKKLYITNIGHEDILNENNVKELNKSLGEYCLQEIYGPMKESVDISLASKRPTSYATEPDFLIPQDDKDYLRNCEMDLFKFISMTSNDNPELLLEELK